LSVVTATVRAMTIQMGGVTIDCADPAKLAEFWSQALGVADIQHYGDYLLIPARTEGGPYVALQKVPEERAAAKNRAHIDFRADDRPAEVARLVGLGATEVEEHTVPGMVWTVLRDPEGNEFCVGAFDG
jgi:predicted enzyme related to lactoylglutathione lyase